MAGRNYLIVFVKFLHKVGEYNSTKMVVESVGPTPACDWQCLVLRTSQKRVKKSWYPVEKEIDSDRGSGSWHPGKWPSLCVGASKSITYSDCTVDANLTNMQEEYVTVTQFWHSHMKTLRIRVVSRTSYPLLLVRPRETVYIRNTTNIRNS